MNRSNTVSLDRAISKLGLYSRKVARELIISKRVLVDGKLVINPELKVIPEKIILTIDGIVQQRAKIRYILFHKPKGLVTTASDELKRDTIYSCFQGTDQHLPCIGRLDMMTSGLLILSNDNRFSSWVTDPLHSITRTYIVKVRGSITSEDKQKMEEGIMNQGELLKAKNVQILKSSGKESLLEVVLTEGKNREIRRLMLAFFCEVTSLKRISFGGLQLGDLEIGKWRDLEPKELKSSFPSYPYPFKSVDRP